jgi:hypothetical protein
MIYNIASDIRTKEVVWIPQPPKDKTRIQFLDNDTLQSLRSKSNRDGL